MQSVSNVQMTAFSGTANIEQQFDLGDRVTGLSCVNIDVGSCHQWLQITGECSSIQLKRYVIKQPTGLYFVCEPSTVVLDHGQQLIWPDPPEVTDEV